MFDVLFIALSLIALDLLWFGASLDGLYRPAILAIQGSPLTVRSAAAVVSWLLMAAGIKYFVLTGYDYKTMGLSNVALRGALLGAVVYGVYNATNYAALTNYPLKMAIADTLWGVTAFGAASVIAAKLL